MDKVHLTTIAIGLMTLINLIGTSSNSEGITTAVQLTAKRSINPTTTTASIIVFQLMIMHYTYFTGTLNPASTAGVSAETDSDDSDDTPIFIPIAVVIGVLLLIAGAMSLIGIILWHKGILKAMASQAKP